MAHAVRVAPVQQKIMWYALFRECCVNSLSVRDRGRCTAVCVNPLNCNFKSCCLLAEVVSALGYFLCVARAWGMQFVTVYQQCHRFICEIVATPAVFFE